MISSFANNLNNEGYYIKANVTNYRASSSREKTEYINRRAREIRKNKI